MGGAHYEHGSKDNQHWDLMSQWDIEYLLATSSKYIVRFDRKGTPKLDLEKSISYVQKQLVCHPNGARRLIPAAYIDIWYGHNDISEQKKLLLELIHVDGTAYALTAAVIAMKEIIDANYSS